MRSFLVSSFALFALCLSAQGQTAAVKTAAADSKGMVPRATPGDYQAHAQVGTMTIGAEFMRHGIPTPQGALSTEDYVVVEAGFFGAEKVRLSVGDFTLKINGKKALPGLPYGMVLSNVKDPEWEPPIAATAKPKGGIMKGGDEGGGGGDKTPPSAPKMSMPEQHAMEQKVIKGALPEGDRTPPVAGLLFFSFRGRSSSIQSVELIYSGPAGKATLALQP